MGEKIKNVSVFAGMLASSHRLVTSGEYESIRDKYRKPNLFDDVSRSKFDKQRAIELGSAGRLVEEICKSGCDIDDIRNVILYSYLLIDSVKYEVDFSQAGLDLGIKDIRDKYNKTNHSHVTKEV